MESISILDQNRERPGHIQALVASVISLLGTASRALEDDQAVARASITRAAALLQVEFDRAVEGGGGPESGALLAWQARRVTQFIDQHIASAIRVSDLSRLLGRSNAHFSRAFKLAFGETPHAYVLRRRVELARYLMLTSAAPLSEIALKCGLTDQAHLCNAFRDRVGQTPAAWRRARTAAHVEPRLA